jgi:beta-alanine degradation protein BauB
MFTRLVQNVAVYLPTNLPAEAFLMRAEAPRKEHEAMTKMAYLIAGLLAGVVLGSFAFGLPPSVIGIQDAAQLAPQMYKVVLDNNKVRVTDYHIQPGDKEPMHSHPFGVVVYYFTDANMRATLPDGKTAESANKAGDVVWRDAVTHSAQNIGNREVHSLLIEPKNSCK